MQKSKIILKRIIIFCIITILISMYFFMRQRTFLNVNRKNRQIILDYLGNEYKNKYKHITKVAYGVEILCDNYVYIYEPFKKVDALLIADGDINEGNLAEYIEENGYEEKNIAICIMGISSIVIIMCTIKRITIYITERKKYKKDKIN